MYEIEISNQFVTSKKETIKLTNPVFTCFCHVFWEVEPEVEFSNAIKIHTYFILTNKDPLQHFKQVKTGLVD